MKSRFQKWPASIWAILLIAGCCSWLRFSNPRWENQDYSGVITWDFAGYYTYLPATVIYGDLDQLAFFDSVNATYQMAPMPYMIHQSPTGKKYIMYPIGVGLAYSPFFFAAHGLCSFTNHSSDGYSLPYRFAVSMGGLFYALLGFWVLRKALSCFFRDSTVAILLIMAFFGTNLLTFSSWYPFGPHIPSLALASWLILLTYQIHQNPKTRHFVYLGFCLGMLVIIRPSNAIVVLFPLLYGLNTKTTRQNKLHLIQKNIFPLFLAVLAALIPVVPQLAYWKWISGQWFFFSYPGEWFDFTQPNLLKQWFSPNKGWLLYTPIMILALLVFIMKATWRQSWALASLVVIALASYILSSWSNWWFGGGGFSQRAYIDFYPFLFLPLGWVFQEAAGRQRVLVISFMSMCLILNLVQNWQYDKGIIGVNNETLRSFRNNFFVFDEKKIDRTSRYQEYFSNEVDTLNPDGFNPRSLGILSFISYRDSAFQGHLIGKDQSFGPLMEETASNMGIPPRGGWIRGFFRIKTADTLHFREVNLVVDCKDKTAQKTYHYAVNPLRITQRLDSNTYILEARSAYPINRFPTDVIRMYLYTLHPQQVEVELLAADLYMMETK
ncbi:MAG TPA: hypothetical protein VFV37_10125 [Luteibaculaceae bacterium]|nr:hypothetical protein [Luteibaculaceae bacterium]